MVYALIFFIALSIYALWNWFKNYIGKLTAIYIIVLHENKAPTDAEIQLAEKAVIDNLIKDFFRIN